MNWYSPEALNGIGVVGLVVFIGGAFVVAITRGWIVPGRYHREVVADRDKEIAELRSENTTKSESNKVLTQALIEKTATEDVTTKLLASVRQALESAR